MKTYKQTNIQLQLYQITPSDQLLSMPAGDIANQLLDDTRIESNEDIKKKLKQVNTLKDLLSALQAENRLITTGINLFLSQSESLSGLLWSKEKSGIRISDEIELKKGEFRSINTSMIAQLRADKIMNGKHYFTVIVTNPVYFSKNIMVDQLVDFFSVINNKLYLPAYDRKKSFNLIVRGVNRVPIYFKEKRSHKNSDKKCRTYGEIFMASNRMNLNEYQSLLAEDSKFDVCATTPYSDYKKQYIYPARNIEIIASDSLIKLKNDHYSVKLPEELDEAIELYRYAKTIIRDEMSAKDELLSKMMGVIGDQFDISEPVNAKCDFISVPRFKLKGRSKINEAVRNEEAYYTECDIELGVNALCYPRPQSTPDQEEKFLKYFSPASKIGQMGFQFNFVPYCSKAAVSDPVKTAERIIKESVGCNSALVAWRKQGSYLPNNKPLEFELMRRNISVQHIIDQGFKVNAPKISALIKGMVEKFPITEVIDIKSDESIKPFDYVFGLDVSRHGKLDIASFPVAIDKSGKVLCSLPDTPYTNDKEKRNESEILTIINSIIANYIDQSAAVPSINVLFLRDGIAYEDYELITKKLPSNVTLTVISVRKNLLNTCSEEIPQDAFYSLYAHHDDNRFVFGVNARQGEHAKLSKLHLAEVIANPLSVSHELLGEILISLSFQNKTTEMELSSLPFPIAYADRMAWTIRDMVQDKDLLIHVSKTYPKEVSSAGNATKFIYNTIKYFVENRANGFSFAI